MYSVELTDGHCSPGRFFFFFFFLFASSYNSHLTLHTAHLFFLFITLPRSFSLLSCLRSLLSSLLLPTLLHRALIRGIHPALPSTLPLPHPPRCIPLPSPVLPSAHANHPLLIVPFVPLLALAAPFPWKSNKGRIHALNPPPPQPHPSSPPHTSPCSSASFVLPSSALRSHHHTITNLEQR
ncbi:unnamed protein product [Mortierella alpina]